MALNLNSVALERKRRDLILALLHSRSNHEAARSAGVPLRTMYNWFRDPAFMAAYRAAQREVFGDAVATLAKTANRAAWALADELDPERATGDKTRVNAASRLLAAAFKAQESILLEEELAHLRATLESLQAGQTPAPPAGT